MMRDILYQLEEAKNRNLILESRVDEVSPSNDDVRALTVKFHESTSHVTVDNLAEFFRQRFSYCLISKYIIGQVPFLSVTFKYPIPRH